MVLDNHNVDKISPRSVVMMGYHTARRCATYADCTCVVIAEGRSRVPELTVADVVTGSFAATAPLAFRVMTLAPKISASPAPVFVATFVIAAVVLVKTRKD